MTHVRSKQAGLTLVVSLIMLVVLTLLVVSAIRFGNINLKVAANAQVDAEAQAASLVAIEQMLQTVDAADDISTVAAVSQSSISTGGTSYKVDVAAPTCITTRYVMNTELNYKTASDRVCYGNNDADQILGSGGTIVAQPTQCKSQQWEVQSSLNDSASAASMTMVQGISARVGEEAQCP
jgi:Tfp pilus assembly protein PilX